MIVSVRIGYAETHHDFIEKWRRIQRLSLSAMVVCRVKHQLIDAHSQIASRKQGFGGATVGVGGGGLQKTAVIAVAGVETNRDSRSRLAASGIQHVSR